MHRDAISQTLREIGCQCNLQRSQLLNRHVCHRLPQSESFHAVRNTVMMVRQMNVMHHMQHAYSHKPLSNALTRDVQLLYCGARRRQLCNSWGGSGHLELRKLLLVLAQSPVV